MVNEQMKIGVNLHLRGDANQKLRDFHVTVAKITESLNVMDARLKKAGNSLNRIQQHLSGLNPRLKEFYEQTNLSKDKLASLNIAAVKGEGAFNKLSRGLGGASEKMQGLTMQAGALKKQLEGVAAAGSLAGAGGAGGGHGGGRGRGHKSGFHVHPFSLAGFGFSGSAMAAGGALILNAKGFRAQSEYQQDIAQMTLQNLPGATTEAVDAFVKAQNIRGVSYTDMAQALTDAAVITRDFGHAKAIAPTLAKMRFAAETVFPGKFSKAQEQAAIKVAEMITGSKDPARLGDALEHMFKVGSSSGWRVMPSDFLAMFKGARGALSGNEDAKNEMFSKIDPDFAFYLMESIIQEIGGPSAGRQLAQAYNHLRAGRLTTAALKDMESFHLIKPGMAEYNKIGMIKRVKPGGVIGSEQNFFDYMTKTWLPAAHAIGITKLEDLKKHILVQFTATDAGLATTIITQQLKLEAAMNANRNASGIDATKKIAENMQAGKLKMLTADWEKFLVSFGKFTEGINAQALDKADRILQFLTKIIDLINGSNEETKLTPQAGKQQVLNQFGLGFGDKSVFDDQEAKPRAESTPQNSQPVVNIHVDGRSLMQTILPHMSTAMYHSNIASPSTFTPFQSPTPVGTSAAVN